MSLGHGRQKVALIMAGGTGGHVFPALAVADLLRESAVQIHWLGTAAGIEATVVPNAGIKLHCIDVKGLRGKGKLGLLKAPWLIFKAILQARKVFKQVKPDVVLGMGGFASGPGAVAAKLAGVPLIIHEQNAKAGVTNKLSLLLAKRKLAAFPGAFGDDVAKGIEIVGNPVRGPILNIQPIEKRYANRSAAINLLIVGGSLGAQAINQVVPQALAQIEVHSRPNVWHQAGGKNIEATLALYKDNGVEAKIDAFIEDMDRAYAWADLVICRAGALTVSELAIAGVASVLVPFPFAVDDHQTANARFLESAGAAILVPQKNLNNEKLLALLEQLNDRQSLQGMAKKAQQLAAPQASVTVANICLEEIQ
ncbi:MAG: undecaprenyldiphospho-muramoylpentapeptide beta-N-acetylglucosaminyltransferase [Pseudomonadales bacterium]|nr:undecaprenyldiphospho-muramoylpentapeptide beta-N-acetylglucosaminyltransferase [Pseudomonadales bacterium]NRA16365.1 undecaprenyldiphospho-muramoylpentapeptide beta-N-acetylglucosaminyltransferase [Oceanospirillaceae bacterium]